jgi:hypothetical protein
LKELGLFSLTVCYHNQVGSRTASLIACDALDLACSHRQRRMAHHWSVDDVREAIKIAHIISGQFMVSLRIAALSESAVRPRHHVFHWS